MWLGSASSILLARHVAAEVLPRCCRCRSALVILTAHFFRFQR
ncbi:unknown [Porcine circovirus 2]|uniref:Uncharacterized protein n=1 Tax=Porcine circovirus 2 TaxID=85708 RepID=Q91HA6_PCV2|nr:unknown [Porcine circovirus 2]